MLVPLEGLLYLRVLLLLLAGRISSTAVRDQHDDESSVEEDCTVLIQLRPPPRGASDRARVPPRHQAASPAQPRPRAFRPFQIGRAASPGWHREPRPRHLGLADGVLGELSEGFTPTRPRVSRKNRNGKSCSGGWSSTRINFF